MRTVWIVIAIIIGLLLFPLTALMQESNPPTVTPTPDTFTEQEFVVVATQVADSALRAEHSADRADVAIEFSFNLLNLFQTFGTILTLLVPIVAIGAGFVGFRRLQSLNQRLDAALEQINQQMLKLDDIKNLPQEILEAKKQAEKSAYRAEAIIDDNKSEFAKLRLELFNTLAIFEKEARDQAQRIEKDAEKQWKEIINKSSAQSLVPIGERQYRIGDFTGAVDVYKRALELDPDSVILHYRLGYVYTQSGMLEEAEVHLKCALDIDKDFASAMACLGYVYRRIGEKMPSGVERNLKLNDASSLLSRALQISPKLIDEDGESWWGSLGGLYRRRGQIDDAIYAYQRVAEATPNSSYAYGNLALLYSQKGNVEAMIQIYEKMEPLAWSEFQAYPDNYWGAADLLTARLALGQVEKAEEALVWVFRSMPMSQPYASESLIETLYRLQQALGEGRGAHIQAFIERIQTQAALKVDVDE